MNTNPNEIVAAIGRVRRAMPRNADVMLVCDVAENSLLQRSLSLDTPIKDASLDAIEEPMTRPPGTSKSGVGFDRKAYMRAYMAKRRAEAKK